MYCHRIQIPEKQDPDMKEKAREADIIPLSCGPNRGTWIHALSFTLGLFGNEVSAPSLGQKQWGRTSPSEFTYQALHTS